MACKEGHRQFVCKQVLNVCCKEDDEDEKGNVTVRLAKTNYFNAVFPLFFYHLSILSLLVNSKNSTLQQEIWAKRKNIYSTFVCMKGK